MKCLPIALFAVLAYGPVLNLRAVASSPAVEVSAEQVQQWVRGLDADEFATREAATDALSSCGLQAIAQLDQANLPAQNLEVVSRGMLVLQELALSDDAQIEDAARGLLEKLASSKNMAASDRASTTLTTLNQLRQSRAVEQLKKFNVRVSVSTTQIGLVLMQELPTIEIGEDFSGTADDLKRLRFLTDVRLVQLAGEKIDDAVLAQVAEMKDLEYLRIKWAKISDAGNAAIAKLPKSQHLSVLYSPITNAGAEALEQTQSLSSLRLYGTQITRPAAMKLNLALGGNDELGRKVDHRQGAFLGIGGDRHTRGCEVTLVQPNSVAQKAGIQPGDVILRFAGEPVADFEALTVAIGKYKARDTVSFDLVRAGETEPRKIEVTLGEWDW
jgi:hypothetical protein